MLEFACGEIYSTENQPKQAVDSLYVADLCVHYIVLMVYSGIEEPQVIGHVIEILLFIFIVNVIGNDGELISVNYDLPHYLSFNHKTFDCLDIVLRNNLDNFMPFERGRSYVKLHFRQKYLS